MFDRSSRPDPSTTGAPRVRLKALMSRARAAPRADSPATVVFTTAEGGVDPPVRFRWLRRRAGRLVRRWLPESPPPKRPAVFVAVAALAGLVVLVGVWWQRPASERPPDLPVTAAAMTATRADLVVVNVVGEVPTPGLVTVTSGARVADAVQAAGGMNPGVRPTGLNLARRVTDGEQVVVGVSTAAPGAPEPAADDKLDLNSATKEQLDGLPGVGPVTAQRIVDRRTKRGPFSSLDQLREIEGIGDSRLAKLRELVRL
jgi:competence protein ComEA